MKKIIISFFVFGLVFVIGGVGKAQTKDSVSTNINQFELKTFNEVKLDASTEAKVDDSTSAEVTDISSDSGSNVSTETTENTPSPAGMETIQNLPVTGNDWVYEGTQGFSGGQAYNESLALDSNNIPYVAYVDSANNFKATVMKYNGTNWVNVGNPGFSLDNASSISLVLDSNNIPYVAYAASEANHMKANVMKFDGINWVSVGSPNFSSYIAGQLSLAIDSNNIPYVAYVDYSVGGKITVMKLNGTNWISVGTLGFSSNPAEDISFSIDSNNTPYIAYAKDSAINMSSISVMKFDGTSWIYVGTQNFSAIFDDANGIGLAIDSNNIPYVAYIDPFNDEEKASVMKFDGTSWVYVGNPRFSAGRVNWLSFAIDSNNTPVLSYLDFSNAYKTTTMKLNGTNWDPVGIPGFSASFTMSISLAIDSNNIPYVAYEDTGNGGGNNKASVMKYVPVNYSFNITSPNGGETLNATDPFTVTWNSGFTSNDPVYFELIHKGVGVISSPTSSPDWGTDEGTDTFYVLTNSTINDGTETFTLPSNIEPGEYTLHGGFVGMDVSDYSDNLFTIN